MLPYAYWAWVCYRSCLMLALNWVLAFAFIERNPWKQIWEISYFGQCASIKLKRLHWQKEPDFGFSLANETSNISFFQHDHLLCLTRRVCHFCVPSWPVHIRTHDMCGIQLAYAFNRSITNTFNCILAFQFIDVDFPISGERVVCACIWPTQSVVD